MSNPKPPSDNLRAVRVLPEREIAWAAPPPGNPRAAPPGILVCGWTPFSFTERASAVRIASLAKDIAALPKHGDVLRVCELARGGVKALLIEQRGQAFDVAVVNYGYRGPIIACTLKYMLNAQVGSQHFFMKKGAAGMFSVFVTD